MQKGISIIIPTYNGGEIFLRCLEGIRNQDYDGRVQLIVIDSGSTDGTVEFAEKAGADVKRIHNGQFHHARTRNHAISLAAFDQVVYTVQDMIPCSETWLTQMATALGENDVAAVYTDQLPHDHAGPYARFEIESLRYFRGRDPLVQDLESYESFREMPYSEAYRSIALDNICAIYRREVLMNSPFPEVDFAEDLAWALENTLQGHRILYQPNIKVKHSHDRSPEYGFSRQVVNSYWCGKIMNRVEEDLSFIEIRDLMSLTDALKRSLGRLRAGILESQGVLPDGHHESPQWLEKVLKRYPLTHKIKRLLNHRLTKNASRRSPELTEVTEQTSVKIRQILESIQKSYSVEGADNILKVVDLSAANAIGRIYGEVYASHLLKGKGAPRFDAFMTHYMHGI